jgi:hypothetical protein
MHACAHRRSCRKARQVSLAYESSVVTAIMLTITVALIKSHLSKELQLEVHLTCSLQPSIFELISTTLWQ